MTSWNLNLIEQTDAVLRTVAALDTEDPAVMAATLRAVADRLDPPKPVRPQWVHDGVRVDRCRGGACDEGHTYTAGCLFANVADRYRGGIDSTMGPPAVVDARATRAALRDANGLPNYAHDADCNTIHDAGPDECPPPRIATPVQIDAMVCPDCIGDRHTYELGNCALKPPWSGVVVSGDGRHPARELRDWERCTAEAPIALGGERCTERVGLSHPATPDGRLEHRAPQADGTTAYWVTVRSDSPPPVAPLEVDAARRVVRDDEKAPGTAPESTESA